MLRERQEVAKQLIGGCSYSAGGKFYESLNAFVRVAKRTFRFRNNAALRGSQRYYQLTA
nr:hypothetical protein [Vibrio parahaemolyticus]